METLWQDIRFGVRWLAEKPSTTIVALATLAIGIGATTAIVSVVNGVLLRPLSFPDPDELVVVWQDHSRIGGPATEWVAPDNFFDWRDENEVFEGAIALATWAPTLSGGDEPERLVGALLSHDGLALLGLDPELGRGFAPEDDAAGSALVVAISRSLWQRRFGGDPNVIGADVVLDGEPATVVGVLPAGARLPIVPAHDIVAPLRLDATNSCGRACVTLRVVGRLKDGVSVETARAEMDTIGARLEETYPDENAGVGVNIVPLHEHTVGSVRLALLFLLGAVGFVLLIACANVANLLLARAADREREVATRVAMGASRARLLRQLLTESALLSSTGAFLGLLLALWGVDWLVSMAPDSLPRLSEVEVDARVLLFTLGVAGITGVAFGVVPALRATNPDLQSSLKEGLRGGSSGGANRFRATLVVVQVALALMLLVGAGLLMRSFVELMNVDTGFEPAGVLAAPLNLVGVRYDEPEPRVALVERLVERARALPGVEAAGVAHVLPLGGANADAGFLIEGRERPRPQEVPVAWYRPATPGYFDAMRMRLVAGRGIRDTDDARATPVVLVNEEASRRYWPNADPLQSRVRIGGEWRQVVGIVADARHFGLEQGDRPSLYMPYAQLPLRSMSFVLRTQGDPEALSASLRAIVREIEPELAVASIFPMTRIVADAVVQPRATTSLFAVFALSALTLAAIGLYGVMSYGVGQRRREIGIRMALGATAAEVLRRALGRGMALLVFGAAVGVAGSLVLGRFMESLLFGVAATDPTTFVLVPLVLGAVAMLACYVPARRAARVDPAVTLRHE